MKTQIDKNNYEEFALDFLEGRLDPELRLVFESFLSLHPEIASEMNGLESLPKEEEIDLTSSKDYSSLKVQISDDLDLQMAALLEDDLPAEQATQLKAQISESAILQQEWKRMQATRLSLMVTIAYPRKSDLYRNESRVIPFFIRFVAIAASVALLIWAGFQFQSNSPRKIAATQTGEGSPQKIASTSDSLHRNKPQTQTTVLDSGVVKNVESESSPEIAGLGGNSLNSSVNSASSKKENHTKANEKVANYKKQATEEPQPKIAQVRSEIQLKTIPSLGADALMADSKPIANHRLAKPINQSDHSELLADNSAGSSYSLGQWLIKKSSEELTGKSNFPKNKSDILAVAEHLLPKTNSQQVLTNKTKSDDTGQGLDSYTLRLGPLSFTHSHPK